MLLRFSFRVEGRLKTKRAREDADAGFTLLSEPGKRLVIRGWARASAQCSTANEMARTKPFSIDSPKAAISQIARRIARTSLRKQ
jgi:hypothetical protein